MKNRTIPQRRCNPPNASVICLQLEEAEGKALEQWSDRFINAGPAEVVRYAMAFMLLNPERFDGWANSIANYCEAEGLDEKSYQLRRIAARYRTRKLKLKGDES